jgi:hypothetical protein
MKSSKRDYLLYRLKQLGRIGPDSPDGISVGEMSQAFADAPPDAKWSQVFRGVLIRHRVARRTAQKSPERNS